MKKLVPTKRVKKITAWSYSRLTTWEECPFKAKMKFIEKVEEPEGPALSRGRAMEDAVYAYLFKRGVTKVPPDGQLFADMLKALKKMASGVLNNREMAFDRDWKPCDWKDWDRVYVRVKMDLLWLSTSQDPFKPPVSQKRSCIRVADLKSGRIYEDKLDQLHLYLVSALCLDDGTLPMMPDVSQADMWYLDQGETRGKSMLRRDLPAAKAAWDERVAPMLADESFLPTPSFRCTRCYLSKKRNKGPCQY